MGIETIVRTINSENVKLDVIAMEMNTQKSTISKMQQKRIGDMNIAKLKEFVEAAGGTMSMQISMPNGEQITV